jgi:NAD(P)H-dependent flavin oxidoreductase YrpB (nitropropane dioxygenase family)
MQTRVSEMLGVEFPILAFSHCRDVVAAVTNAGGFGVLGAVAHTPQQLDIDMNWIEEQTKGKPYGVDLLLPAKYADIGGEKNKGGGAPSIDRDTLQQLLPPQQQEFVDDILERYGVPKLDESADVIGAIGRRGGMLNVAPEGYEPLLDVAFAHKIRLIASALGAPPPSLLERAKGEDVLVAALAGTRPHAERHQAAGVDIIVAQGTEAGGHTGEISTMVLIPEVVDAVGPDTMVLAAGGIGRGRQMAAGLALGADGVWTGSIWLTVEEADTPEASRDRMLAATSRDTVRSRSWTGKPARMLKTAWTDAWESPESPGTLPMPMQFMLISDALARINRAGAGELTTFPVGQIVGTMNQVKPVSRVIYEMVEEYIETMERLGGLIED